jgi:antitoxin CcdA
MKAEGKSIRTGTNVSLSAREARWLEENFEALESFNRYVEEHGLPLAKYRLF